MAQKLELINNRRDLKTDIKAAHKQHSQARRQQFVNAQINKYNRTRKSFNARVKASTFCKGDDTHASTSPMTQLRDPDTGVL